MPCKKSCIYSYLKNAIVIMVLCVLAACSSLASIENSEDSIFKKSEELINSSVIGSKYKGWDFLANHLMQDKVPSQTVTSVLNSEQMPAISFIPFKLNPVESHQIYNSTTALERIDRAQVFADKYKDAFTTAESKFGVSRYIIAAIISVETNCGTIVGKEKVFYRLARIASTGETKNLELNFKKLLKTDSSVTLEQVRARSEYLFKTFYPQILSLFQYYQNRPDQILELKGSFAGAFGLAQFLPLSLEKYGIDGNNDNVVDLFNPEDAIFSVANFLKSHGWRKFLSTEEKLAALWNYNRSDAYGRAIIRVALNLQGRALKLDM